MKQAEKGRDKSPSPIKKGEHKMAEIIIDNETMTAFVDNFKGFTPEWEEIVLPYDQQAVRVLEGLGYDILYGSDDI